MQDDEEPQPAADVDGEDRAEEPAPEAQASAPRPPVHLAFCESQCKERATCPTRLGFRRLAEAHTLLADAYRPEEHPEVDAQLERIEPAIRFFQDLRSACARERHAEHEEQARARELLRPLLQELLAEELAKVHSQRSHDPSAGGSAQAAPHDEARAEG